MKKFRTVLLVFAIILFCFVIQTSILPMVLTQDITPNLMIIVAAAYGFMFGDRKGMVIGMVCGLLCDIYFGPLIGFEAGVYADRIPFRKIPENPLRGRSGFPAVPDCGL